MLTISQSFDLANLKINDFKNIKVIRLGTSTFHRCKPFCSPFNINCKRTQNRVMTPKRAPAFVYLSIFSSDRDQNYDDSDCYSDYSNELLRKSLPMIFYDAP